MTESNTLPFSNKTSCTKWNLLEKSSCFLFLIIRISSMNLHIYIIQLVVTMTIYFRIETFNDIVQELMKYIHTTYTRSNSARYSILCFKDLKRTKPLIYNILIITSYWNNYLINVGAIREMTVARSWITFPL